MLFRSLMAAGLAVAASATLAQTDFPAKKSKEFVAVLKKSPGKYSCASA